jgi:sigma-B regulation protein RsbU (phosphoserine phosphatase)
MAGPGAGLAPVSPAPAPQPPTGGPLSIVDFLTDGSLVLLCDELSRLTGVTVKVRAAGGGRVVKTGAAPGWAVVNEPPGPGAGRWVVPLRAAGAEIGSLEVEHDGPELSPAARAMLDRTLPLLAMTVEEVCERDLELERRFKEMSVLYRLSGLLARATSVDEMLRIGLDSALDVLGLDAGSLVLLPENAEKSSTGLDENEQDLILKASRNLSREWLEDPAPVSRNREFDREALRGQSVIVEDLLTDGRVQLLERTRREGLRSFINAGLVFQDRPIGVIRLYARTPRQFTPDDQRLLRSIGQQLAVAVEQSRLLKLQEEDRRIQRQLRLAADVQGRMMPRVIPALPRLEVAARWIPSVELSGDFYDLFEKAAPSGAPGLGIVVGDVVGKGIAAALLMAGVKSSLRAHAAETERVEDVASRVNRDLCRDTRESEFVTFWFGVVDPSTLELTCCSAGHDPVILVRPRAGGSPEVTELGGSGLVAGIEPGHVYTSTRHTLRPGDILVVCTDGVSDAMDFSGARFGRARVRRAAQSAASENPRATAAEVLERIFWEIRQFAGLAPRTDDQTVVVLRVRE